jgi:hypothetical protein
MVKVQHHESLYCAVLSVLGPNILLITLLQPPSIYVLLLGRQIRFHAHIKEEKNYSLYVADGKTKT